MSDYFFIVTFHIAFAKSLSFFVCESEPQKWFCHRVGRHLLSQQKDPRSSLSQYFLFKVHRALKEQKKDSTHKLFTCWIKHFAKFFDHVYFSCRKNF